MSPDGVHRRARSDRRCEATRAATARRAPPPSAARSPADDRPARRDTRRYRDRRPPADALNRGRRWSKIASRRPPSSISEERPRDRSGRLGHARRRHGVKTAAPPRTKGELTLVFDRVTINGRNYSIRATVTQALQSDGDKPKVGGRRGGRRDHRRHSGGLKGALAGS